MIRTASRAFRPLALALGTTLGAALAAHGLSAAPPPAASHIAAAPAADITELDQGHADIGPVLVDGRWRIEIKDDSGGEAVWRDPDSTVLRVRDAAEHELPDSSDYAFLGEPGDEVFLIPQTQLDGVIWLGWNTQHPALLDDPPQQISFRLHDVVGPGRLHVYFDYGGFRPAREVWDGSDPGEPLRVEPNTHAHANWAFSAAGEYRVGFTAEIVDAAGVSHTASATLHFLVGDDAESTAGSPLSVPVTLGALLGVLLLVLLLLLLVLVVDVRGARRRRAL
ncbi:choice-of-anchor M domain-containing protein [Microbacterium marinilacus]|uniref:Surface-anchored protein n=1 Tax=Microbacterium marinilacus TaxID=415209 RepID=A0ABP7BKN6_9MICO|nr:choice-of-anchor M domain-containing protein [Microbacterium marinilacus]MBY0687650.1 choice-of-anchor M domain-containing protein [Microbacterium marinilacus]